MDAAVHTGKGEGKYAERGDYLLGFFAGALVPANFYARDHMWKSAVLRHAVRAAGREESFTVRLHKCIYNGGRKNGNF